MSNAIRPPAPEATVPVTLPEAPRVPDLTLDEVRTTIWAWEATLEVERAERQTVPWRRK